MLKRLSFIVVLGVIPVMYFLLASGPNDICNKVDCVTVAEIEKSIANQAPMNVGFDIDETVLFGSPVFYHVANEQCEGKIFDCMETSAFWEATNRLDSFSLPKKKGVELVNMHLARGDTVYFITARRGTASETVTETLRKLFNTPTLQQVIFTGYSKTENLKIAPIKDHKIAVFYGDSDTDIEAAIAAGARPIRILRAPNTLETHTNPKVGAYDEEVVRDSGV